MEQMFALTFFLHNSHVWGGKVSVKDMVFPDVFTLYPYYYYYYYYYFYYYFYYYYYYCFSYYCYYCYPKPPFRTCGSELSWSC